MNCGKRLTRIVRSLKIDSQTITRQQTGKIVLGTEFKTNLKRKETIMKKTWIFAGIISCGVLIYQPVSAKCVPLIQEAREQLASAQLTKADEAKVKALLVEADKLSEANNHKEGIQKANEALAIIKRK
jgi:hypothetical protein